MGRVLPPQHTKRATIHTVHVDFHSIDNDPLETDANSEFTVVPSVCVWGGEDV